MQFPFVEAIDLVPRTKIRRFSRTVEPLGVLKGRAIDFPLTLMHCVIGETFHHSAHE